MNDSIQKFNELSLLKTMLHYSCKIDMGVENKYFFLINATPMATLGLFASLSYFNFYPETLWGILSVISSIILFFVFVGSICFLNDSKCMLYKDKQAFYQKIQNKFNLDSVTYNLILNLINDNGELPHPDTLKATIRKRTTQLKHELNNSQSLETIAKHLAHTNELYQKNTRNILFNDLLEEHNRAIEESNKEAQKVQEKMQKAGINLPEREQPKKKEKLVISSED